LFSAGRAEGAIGIGIGIGIAPNKKVGAFEGNKIHPCVLYNFASTAC